MDELNSLENVKGKTFVYRNLYKGDTGNDYEELIPAVANFQEARQLFDALKKSLNIKQATVAVVRLTINDVPFLSVSHAFKLPGADRGVQLYTYFVSIENLRQLRRHPLLFYFYDRDKISGNDGVIENQEFLLLDHGSENVYLDTVNEFANNLRENNRIDSFMSFQNLEIAVNVAIRSMNRIWKNNKDRNVDVIDIWWNCNVIIGECKRAFQDECQPKMILRYDDRERNSASNIPVKLATPSHGQENLKDTMSSKNYRSNDVDIEAELQICLKEIEDVRNRLETNTRNDNFGLWYTWTVEDIFQHLKYAENLYVLQKNKDNKRFSGIKAALDYAVIKAKILGYSCNADDKLFDNANKILDLVFKFEKAMCAAPLMKNKKNDFALFFRKNKVYIIAATVLFLGICVYYVKNSIDTSIAVRKSENSRKKSSGEGGVPSKPINDARIEELKTKLSDFKKFIDEYDKKILDKKELINDSEQKDLENNSKQFKETVDNFSALISENSRAAKIKEYEEKLKKLQNGMEAKYNNYVK